MVKTRVVHICIFWQSGFEERLAERLAEQSDWQTPVGATGKRQASDSTATGRRLAERLAGGWQATGRAAGRRLAGD
jgi:hypothetical protein